MSLTMLCLASYHKGLEFLREAKRQGCRVLLVTSASLRDADWPRDSLDDIFYIHDDRKRWKIDDLILGTAHLARRSPIDRIVPLDDFDLEKASALREHLRIPGMGETTMRHFRDKLAMRMKAQEEGLPVPAFVHVLNDDRIREFCRRVPPPWFLKPRHQAGSIGIRKINGEDELWAVTEALGDERSYFLLEEFVAGDVCHVDSIVYQRDVVAAVPSKYGTPPFDVTHSGGVFTTRLMDRTSAEASELLQLNKQLLVALGLVRGVSHSEYIRGENGRLVFLETSARVGGAHIAELIEAATGVNMWAEWAKIEVAGGEKPYRVPAMRNDYAGLIVSLARQESPDLGDYTDPEIVWRLDKPSHAGVIVRSPHLARVDELLTSYESRFRTDFVASLPASQTPYD
ncbi:MAG TPA: ATP-grasp domain-containing protein [Vicinamibacterales bacterium]|nr:ATP-grasp domain-containing protein [Vicinamibacterales bacterium]